ncbi:hypothetical protein VTO42DRAFT_6941 [Malbranchea cinnamomea]
MAADRKLSLAELQEVEPFPEDNLSPDLERGDYVRSESAKDSPSKGQGKFALSKLGLTEHNVESFLTTVQKLSTGAPTIFFALHVTNTSLIPLATQSVSSSEPFLLLTRPIYQSPVCEPLLLTVPLLLHVASGLGIRYIRLSRRARLYGAETREERRALRKDKSLSVQSRLGYVLAPLLGVHVLVNRLVPIWVDGGSSGVGLGYVAHGFAQAPWLWRTYYIALVGAGVWHITYGWAYYLGWRDAARGVEEQKKGQTTGANGGYLGSVAGSEVLRQRKRRRRILNGLVIAGTALWLAGGLGVIGTGGLGDAWEAKHWDMIYSKIPLLGRYLTSSTA